MGRVISNADAVKRAAREKMRAGLTFMAIRAREIAERELSQSFPPASTPGQYPARRTGQLVDSLRHGFDEANFRSFYGVHDSEPQYEGNGHAGGRHWVWLMARGRLGLENPVLDNRGELVQEFQAGVESVQGF